MSSVAKAGGGPDLVVDLDSPVPPFEQIRVAVAGLVASGGLAAGVRLPSVRQLAADLGIAPGTVQRAYTELRAAGVLSTANRRGVVVTGRPNSAKTSAGSPATDHLAVDAARFVERARHSGASDAAIRSAVEAALAG